MFVVEQIGYVKAGNVTYLPLPRTDKERLKRLIIRETAREIAEFEADRVPDHGQGQF